MTLLNIYGKETKKNVSRFVVDWDKPCRSKIQFEVKQFLKPFWYGYICYEEFPVFGSQLKIDFYNASRKIAIEVQGNQHNKFNKFFHNNSRLQYLNSIRRDYTKIEWCDLNGIKLLEVMESEVPNLTKDFLEKKYAIRL